MKSKLRMDSVKCEHCMYSQRFDISQYYCTYILQVGHSRGCPGGDACTVYKKRKVKK